MKFSYDGDEYDVRFYYDWVNSTATSKPVRQTRCTISFVHPDAVGRERYKLLVSECVVQHVNDQFCRRAGRKLALRRAISAFMTDYVKYSHSTMGNKMVRRNIWNAYFESCDKNMLPVNKKKLKEKRYQEKALKEANAWV